MHTPSERMKSRWVDINNRAGGGEEEAGIGAAEKVDAGGFGEPW